MSMDGMMGGSKTAIIEKKKNTLAPASLVEIKEVVGDFNLYAMNFSRESAAVKGTELLGKLKDLSQEEFAELLDKNFDETLIAIIGLSYSKNSKDSDGGLVWRVKSEKLATLINNLSEEKRNNLFQYVLGNNRLLGVTGLKELKEIKNSEITISSTGSKLDVLKNGNLPILQAAKEANIKKLNDAGDIAHGGIEGTGTVYSLYDLLYRTGINLEDPKFRKEVLDKVIILGYKDQADLTVGDVIAIKTYGKSYTPEISVLTSTDETLYQQKVNLLYDRITYYGDAALEMSVNQAIQKYLGYDRTLGKLVASKIDNQGSETVDAVVVDDEGEF
jgi:hypothetical protein